MNTTCPPSKQPGTTANFETLRGVDPFPSALVRNAKALIIFRESRARRHLARSQRRKRNNVGFAEETLDGVSGCCLKSFQALPTVSITQTMRPRGLRARAPVNTAQRINEPTPGPRHGRLLLGGSDELVIRHRSSPPPPLTVGAQAAVTASAQIATWYHTARPAQGWVPWIWAHQPQ